MQNRIVHDEELIQRLQRGDEWVFQLLVRRFREKVYATAFGITLDHRDSRAVFKAAFQSIYDGTGTFSSELALSTLVYRVTVEQCYRQKRKWGHRLSWRPGCKGGGIAAGGVADPQKRSGDSLSFDRDCVKETLAHLPEPIRTVYVLREGQRLSYETIAAVLGIRVGVVRTRMFHARQWLSRLLQPVQET